MMKIKHYEFGRIRIGDQNYTSDVIIGPEGVFDHWWRRQGHSLCPDDLEAVVDADPEYLVIGTGYFGQMRVPESTRQFLAERGIGLWQGTTGNAVDEFNRLQAQSARVVAALHLTC